MSRCGIKSGGGALQRLVGKNTQKRIHRRFASFRRKQNYVGNAHFIYPYYRVALNFARLITVCQSDWPCIRWQAGFIKGGVGSNYWFSPEWWWWEGGIVLTDFQSLYAENRDVKITSLAIVHKIVLCEYSWKHCPCIPPVSSVGVRLKVSVANSIGIMLPPHGLLVVLPFRPSIRLWKWWPRSAFCQAVLNL